MNPSTRVVISHPLPPSIPIERIREAVRRAKETGKRQDATS